MGGGTYLQYKKLSNKLQLAWYNNIPTKNAMIAQKNYTKPLPEAESQKEISNDGIFSVE